MVGSDNAFVIIQIVGAVVAGFTLLGGFAAALFGYMKAQGNEKAIGILTDANAGLIAVNEELRRKNLETVGDFTEKLRVQELECTRQIAQLEGRVSALTEGLARQVVDAVMSAIEHKSVAESKTVTSTTVEKKSI